MQSLYVLNKLVSNILNIMHIKMKPPLKNTIDAVSGPVAMISVIASAAMVRCPQNQIFKRLPRCNTSQASPRFDSVQIT